VIVDELPLTHSGKIDRPRVAHSLESRPGVG
jgi:acyl-coenzyme A synthetase/AMP-(fatty) acid ligase